MVFNESVHLFLILTAALLNDGVFATCDHGEVFTELVNCDCHDTTVNCRSQSFTDVPRVPLNTTHLILSNNNISHLKPFLEYPSLSVVDLSGNKLISIGERAFEKVNNIQELYMKRNRLDFDQLPPALFDPLRSLKILDISFNYMWLTSNRYRDDLFANLTSLEYLEMDGLVSAVLGTGFTGLTSLTSLTFQSGIQNLTNETFTNLFHLPIKTLKIYSGWLKDIESFAFANFPRLETLDISYNPRLGFDSAARAWPGLQYTNITSLVFQYSAPFDTEIITMDDSFFEGLNKTNITKLAIDGNQIITLKAEIVQHLPELEHLSFSYNRLIHVAPVVIQIALMDNLVSLDASQQSIRPNTTERELMAGTAPIVDAFKDIWFAKYGTYFTNLTNILETLCPTLPVLEYLNVADHIDDVFEFKIVVPLYTPDTLRFINLSSSLSITLSSMPMIVVFNGLSIQYLDYSGNGLNRLDNPIVFINESKYNFTFNLRHNSLVSVSDVMALPDTPMSRQTEALLLGHNHLGDILAIRGADMISSITYLKVLELSDNLIKRLPPNAFIHFVHLEELFLQDNSIRQLNFHINVQNLHLLDLSSNLLASIDNAARNELDQAGEKQKRSNTNLELHLVGNPLICSCETIDFLRWTRNRHRDLNDGLVLVEFESLACVFQNNVSFFTDIDSIIKTLTRQCNITKYILSAFIPAAIIAIVVGLSVFLHRHRFDIRFWFINISIRRKQVQEQNESYTYDAFVIYSDSNVGWVKNKLLPMLEKDWPENNWDKLSLAVHHRNFIPGHSITENIVNFLKESRKVIVVIDRELLTSNWCTFEVRTAQCVATDKGRDNIIPVLFEPMHLIQDNNIYKELKAILRKKTYIEWPNNTSNTAGFWRRLQKAIRDRIVRPLQCDCGRVIHDTASPDLIRGTTDVNHPSDTTDVNHPSDTTDVNHPSDTTNVNHPSDTTDVHVNRPSDTTDVNRTSDTTDVNRPSDTTDVNRAADTTDVNRPSDTTYVNRASDTTDVNHLSGTTDMNLPTGITGLSFPSGISDINIPSDTTYVSLQM